MEIDIISYLYLDLLRLQNKLFNLHSLIIHNNSNKKALNNYYKNNLNDKIFAIKSLIQFFSPAYLKSTMGVVLNAFKVVRAISLVFSFLIRKISVIKFPELTVSKTKYPEFKVTD